MAIERAVRPENVITVIGSAEVRARANIMHVSLEIRTRGMTALEALDENNRREEATRCRLRRIGVHEESIESSGVTFLQAAGEGIMLPGASEPLGFVAVRNLSVNLYVPEDEAPHLFSRIARILDEASDAGAQAGARHQVNFATFRSPSVSFGLENDEAPRVEALRRAMVAARSAAEETSHSMGADLGEIVSTQIVELGSLVQGRHAAGAYGLAGIDMPRPPEAGRVMVRAVVALTYRVHHSPPRSEHDHLGHFTLERTDSPHTSHVDHTPELS